MLGTAKKCAHHQGRHDIIDGSGKKVDIQARVGQLKQQIEETTSDYDKEKLQERLAKLAGGVAVIRVGGATEVEVKTRRIASMTRSTRPRRRWRKAFSPAAARHSSTLPGRSAGCSATMKTRTPASPSCARPYNPRFVRLPRNCGVEASIVVGKLLEQKSNTYGFDAQTEKYVDLVESGIVDPTQGRAHSASERSFHRGAP